MKNLCEKMKERSDVDEWIKQFLLRFTFNIFPPFSLLLLRPSSFFSLPLSLKFSKDKKWLHFLYFVQEIKSHLRTNEKLECSYENILRAGGWKKNCGRILQSKVSEKNVYKKGKRTYFDCVTHLVFLFVGWNFALYFFFRHTADIIWGMKGTDTENSTQRI